MKCKAVVIGPGLGTDPDTAEEIRAVVAGATVPVVIDADALTALGDAGAARSAPPRVGAPPRCSRRTTASTPVSRESPRAVIASTRHAGWPRRRVPSCC